MRISQLAAGLECEIIGGDCRVTGLSYDSRRVQPGDVFFAIRGFKTDGHKYIEQAAANGAAAVVVDTIQVLDSDITQVVVADTRVAMAEMSAAFFQHPSRKLRVIGVTGTNGKTTTTYLIKAILEQAGFKVGLIGTIQTLIDQTVIPAVRTTPESLDLQSLLARMVAEQVEYVVMEVSSHALELNRTAGLEFDAAVFTNLTQIILAFIMILRIIFKRRPNFCQSGCSWNQPKTGGDKYDDSYGLKMAAQSSAQVFSYDRRRLNSRLLLGIFDGMKYQLVPVWSTT